MSGVPTPPMLTCPQWGAKKPTHPPIITSRPTKVIVHHTAGHAAVSVAATNYGREQAIKYAQALQLDMMHNRGWSDSGHNFLVMRSGYIVQGRWGTVTAIEHGRMVVSAHCPGQNDQPGIEHEHNSGDKFTVPQQRATVWLMAWICDQTGMRPTELYGHQQFYPTACPGNLQSDIPALRVAVAGMITFYTRSKPKTSRSGTARRAVKRELKH